MLALLLFSYEIARPTITLAARATGLDPETIKTTWNALCETGLIDRPLRDERRAAR
jgi:hypothetical protein